MDLDGDGEITKEEAAAVGGGEEGMLVLPPIAGMKRIAYSIYEVEVITLLTSDNDDAPANIVNSHHSIPRY